MIPPGLRRSGPSPPILGDLVFHCQQATEKLLKAFLVWHDVVFRKTHNLEELGEQRLAIDPTLREVVDRAVPLTEYAWRFRPPQLKRRVVLRGAGHTDAKRQERDSNSDFSREREARRPLT